MYIYPEGGTCMKCPCQHFAPQLSSSDNSPSPTDICAVCPCAAGYHKHSTVAAEPAAEAAARIDLQPYGNNTLYLMEGTRRRRGAPSRIGEQWQGLRGKPIVLPREVLVVIYPGSQLEGWKRFHRGSLELNKCI